MCVSVCVCVSVTGVGGFRGTEYYPWRHIGGASRKVQNANSIETYLSGGWCSQLEPNQLPFTSPLTDNTVMPHVPENWPPQYIAGAFAGNFPIARYASTPGSQVLHSMLHTLIPLNPCRPPQSLYNSKTMNTYTIDKTPTNAYSRQTQRLHTLTVNSHLCMAILIFYADVHLTA